jgi:hypothetical protein
MNNTETLIDKLTKAIAFKFSSDKTAPGLTIAALKKGYYCSVVRYEGAFAKDKKVFCSAKADTMADAVKGVADQFLKASKKDPIQELDELIKPASSIKIVKASKKVKA